MEGIVEIAGFQYKVREKDIIKVPKLNAEESAELIFPVCILIGDKTIIGQPYVKDAECKAKVIEFGRDPKLVIYKYKPKKRYRRKKGHRQPYTKLLIEKISYIS